MKGREAETLDRDDRKFLEEMAGWLARRRLSVPAILFLESTKPLNFVGSQFLFFFEPMVKAVVEGKGYTRFAALMEKRENVETFMQCIEAADRIEKDRLKEEKR